MKSGGFSKLLISVFLLFGFQAKALSLEAIIFEKNGDQAALLVLDEVQLNTGALLSVEQTMTGESGRARVSGPSGLGVFLDLLSNAEFVIGPTKVTVISNPVATDAGSDEAIVGDLITPLFEIDNPR